MGSTHSTSALAVVVSAVTLTACASAPAYPGYEMYQDTVPPPMATREKDAAAKTFNVAQGRARVYIYRTGTEPMKFLVWIDRKMVEELPPRSFMVVGMTAREHSITACDGRIVPPRGEPFYTKSKDYFGTPLPFAPEPSRNIYIKISSKSWVRSPIANIEVVTDEEKAQEEIRKCGLIERRWPVEERWPDVFQ